MREPKQKSKIPILNQWTIIDQHLFNESEKHDLDFDDLYHATYCIEHKYKGNRSLEAYYASLINNASEHLWHEAYFCALFIKTFRWEKWQHHIPNMNDVMAVRKSIDTYNKRKEVPIWQMH